MLTPHLPENFMQIVHLFACNLANKERKKQTKIHTNKEIDRKQYRPPIYWGRGINNNNTNNNSNHHHIINALCVCVPVSGAFCTAWSRSPTLAFDSISLRHMASTFPHLPALCSLCGGQLWASHQCNSPA